MALLVVAVEGCPRVVVLLGEEVEAEAEVVSLVQCLEEEAVVVRIIKK
jgi:hypothetical protein